MTDLNAPHSMGTTIIGVTYNGSVFLGADSRTSTGLYIANRASDKITQRIFEITEHMNYGPGLYTKYRFNWGGYNNNCSEDIVKQFTVGKFLHEVDDWLVSTGFSLFSGSQ